jgi:hypothetical protein
MSLDPCFHRRPSPPTRYSADLFVEPKRLCLTWPPHCGVSTISGWRTNSGRLFCTADSTTWTSKWRNSCASTVTTDHFAPTQIQIPASGWRWAIFPCVYNLPMYNRVITWCQWWWIGLGDSSFGPVAISRLGKSFLRRQATARHFCSMDFESSNEWRQFRRPWRILFPTRIAKSNDDSDNLIVHCLSL